MKKMCKIHGNTQFRKEKNGRVRCKKCSSEAVSRRRRFIKLKAIKYKGGKCQNCGYSKCVSALAFHHINPSKKDFRISHGNTKSWKKVMLELDKCLLLCHNCHSEIHEDYFKKTNPKLHERLNNFSPRISTKYLCSDCGKEISINAKKCKSCYKLNIKTKIIWPKTDELIKMVSESSYLQVAKKLGVSDNAIRKRIKNHPIP